MKGKIKVILTVILMVTLVMMMTPSVMADGTGSSEVSTAVSQEQPSDEGIAEDQTASDQSQTTSDQTAEDNADDQSGTTSDKDQQDTEDTVESDAVKKKAAEPREETTHYVTTAKAVRLATTLDAFDNSTTLSDGTYIPSGITVSGGTGKVTITCPQITVKGGKAYGKIIFSSKFYTKIKVSGVTYKATTVGTASVFADVPVELNKDMEITGTTTAMSAAHDVIYKVNVKLAEPAVDASTVTVDNSTDIKDNSYKPDSFTYSGGSGKVKISCSQITVSDGHAFATIVFGSRYYTKLKADGRVYDGIIDTAKGTSTYVIPLSLNKDNTIIGTTTAMAEAHDITYTVRAGLTSSSAIIKADDPSSGDTGKDDITTDKKKKLKDGTYKIRTEVTGKMFYIYPRDASVHYSIITVMNGKIKATITLNGQGYDYVYMGTESQAKKASKSSWIKYKAKNGFYSYTIPVSKLDTKLNISAHSRNYNKWYGDRTIKFYSGTAKKVKSGTTTTGNKKNTYKRNSGKATVVSASATTASVNNSTTLKDGTYSPDSFNWSGGSGRLAYIRCSKITVSNGRAYAAITFSSSSYDSLKAGGRIYAKTGGGMSTFVIPVKLNANNTIIGRTTAMSSAHWVRYSIYIAKAEGGASTKATTLSTYKMPTKAPTITGLTYKSTVKIKKAGYFKIFKYEDGVTLIVMDLTSNTELYQKSKSESKSADKVEYDEEGNPIAKSQHEITEALYQNNIVNYLVVPKGYDVPAGLDKKCIIVEKPVKDAYVASDESLAFMDRLSVTDKIGTVGISKSKIKTASVSKALKAGDIKYAGSYKSPDYSTLVKNKTKLCILSDNVLPAKVEGKTSGIFASKKAKKAAAEAKDKEKSLTTLEERFTALSVPVLVDRSADEKGKLAKAEWIKVYGVLSGQEKKAVKIFNKEVNDEK